MPHMTAGNPPAAPTQAVPPAPPDPLRVAEAVRVKLPFSATLLNIAPLAGDASNRRYFRLRLQGTRASAILMQLASPEGFKQSEEAVTGTCTINELPFINILDHLAKADVPVPVLYHYDADAGLLYLEDLGDLTLVAAYHNTERPAGVALYREAIDILTRIQVRASSPNPRCLAFLRSFDVPLFMWEFDHYLEYGVEARHRAMSSGDRDAVRQGFGQVAAYLAAQPKVFTHRDYHSRNLMVRETETRPLSVIDFQDALLGPMTYDLASLLRDAYLALDESLIDELLEYYRELMTRYGRALPDHREFRKLFDLTSIQRNLKAAGRFVYIDRVKGNPSFLTDIPRVLGYVRQNLPKYPELAAVRRSLARYVPELQ
jgi:aminoglycoside/choline kinase family phosphotransferase